MTDPDLIAKKLAVIETHVRELRSLADAFRNRLSDLLEFADAIRARIGN